MSRSKRVTLCLLICWMTVISGCGSEAVTIKTAESSAKFAPVILDRVDYYGDSSFDVVLTPKEQTLLNETITGNCSLDPSLVMAARKHAEDLSGRNGSPSGADIDYLRFALIWAGSVDYMIQPLAVRLDSDGVAALARFVEKHSAQWTHCGLGISDGINGETAVWIGTFRTIEINRTPVRIPVKKTTRVTGRILAAGVKSLHAYLGLPHGGVEVLTVRGDGGSGFVVEIYPKTSGRFELELAIDTGRGPETVSLLPLYAGVPPQARPIVTPDVTLGNNVLNSEQTLVSLINNARKHVGLFPLIRDKRLDKVAKSHSRDMVTLGYFGHRSPQNELLADRLQARNLYPAEIAENVARSGSTHRVHRNLMRSPSHRLKLLSNSMTHIGVGVAKDGDDIVVTEIFARW